MTELANKVIQVCRELSLCTEVPGQTTRTFLSPPMHDVHRRLSVWMREAGMKVSVDAAGNLRGVRNGRLAKRIAIVSHLDTVPDAGAFDGILGVAIGVALVAATADAPGTSGPAIEVIGFSEEEGVRFGIPFIGSRAAAGTLDENVLTPGVVDAIRAFGLDPNQLPAAGFHGRPRHASNSISNKVPCSKASDHQSESSMQLPARADSMSRSRAAPTMPAQRRCRLEETLSRLPRNGSRSWRRLPPPSRVWWQPSDRLLLSPMRRT